MVEIIVQKCIRKFIKFTIIQNWGLVTRIGTKYQNRYFNLVRWCESSSVEWKASFLPIEGIEGVQKVVVDEKDKESDPTNAFHDGWFPHFDNPKIMDLIQVVRNVWPIPSSLFAMGYFETVTGLGFSFRAKIDIVELDIFKIRGHDDGTSDIKLFYYRLSDQLPHTGAKTNFLSKNYQKFDV